MNRPPEDHNQVRFQRSTRSIPIYVGGTLLCLALIAGGHFEPEYKLSTTIAAFVLGFLIVLFGTLSVSVYDEVIVISYGIGIFRRIIDVHTLSDIRLVPNRFLSALYNMRAEHVLQISDRWGSRAIIGVGDARDILNFLRGRIRR